MDFRLQVALCLATLALGAGCRQNNAHRELLERELRFQEDRIYRLEAELQTTRQELSRYCITSPPPDISTDNGSPTFSNPTVMPESRSAMSPKSSDHSTPKHEFAPSVDLPPPTVTKKEAAPPFIVPPVILPPDPNVPEGLPSRSVTPGASSTPTLPSFPTTSSPAVVAPNERTPKEPVLKPMSSPKFLSPSQRLRVPVENDAGASLPPEPVPQGVPSAAVPKTATSSDSPPPQKIAAVPMPSDERVTSLTFGKRTGGLNLDGRPGDEGIFVVLEPRSGQGDVIAGNGDLSVVLIDPAVAGEGGRYARWEFSGSDLAALFRPASSDGPAGTYLELSWPDAPPQHARLKLFVRLRTPDGRQLQVDRDLSVSLPAGATTIAPPPPFTPTLAPPQVTPVGAPMPDEHDRNAPPVLNWGRPAGVLQAIPSAEASPLPPLPAQPSGAIYEPTPIDGPSLGPALIPASPR